MIKNTLANWSFACG